MANTPRTAQVDAVEMWEVYDEWEAMVLGYFFRQEDAKLFRQAYDEKRNHDRA